MNIDKVDKAEIMAKRFLSAALIVRRSFEKDKFLFYGSSETAALRRASMELTRALADLRKSE